MTSKRKSNPQYLTYSKTIQLINKGNTHTLAARGVHLPKVYVLHNSQGSEELINFYPNRLDTFFQILPKLNFEANALLDETEKTNQRYSTFEKRKRVEDEINLNLIQDMVGKNIRLGDDIQLLHQSTGLYVSIVTTKAPAGKYNLLTLTKKISEAAIFKIKSPLAFRKTGSLILIGDEFSFFNVNKSVVYPIVENLNKQNIISLYGIGGEKVGKNWLERKTQDDLRLSVCPENQKMFSPVYAGNTLDNDKGTNYSSDFIAEIVDYQNISHLAVSTAEFKFGDYIRISKMEDSGLANYVYSECNVSALNNIALTRIEKRSQSRFLNNLETVFQILPKHSEKMGAYLFLNPFKEVDVYLKHVLTGKLLYFNPETSRLELADDFGYYRDYIRNNKSKIKSKYADRKDEYEDILDNDTITDKDEEVKKYFTYAEVQDFKEFETVCEHEELFDDQYCRDTLINLKIFSKGDKFLKSSSYFSIRNYHAENLISIIDNEGIEELAKKQTIRDPKFEKTFSYEEDFMLELLKYKKYKEQEESDHKVETYFYFEKIKDLDFQLLENLSATIPDFVRYLKCGVNDTKNATTVLLALDYINKNMSSINLTRNQFQHFLRQSCIVDIFMLILQEIYRSNIFTPKTIKLPIKIYNTMSRILQKFVEDNVKCAEYLYQWKEFFKDFLNNQRSLHQKVPPFGILISTVFEMTGNYEIYLHYNLESTCQKIEFCDFNKNELQQFLKMLRTSQRMNEGKIDNLIIETVVFSQYQDKIFYPMELNDIGEEKERVQIKVSSGITLTLNAEFTFTQEMESEYLKNVINAASIICGMAPNRVYEKMSKKFPKDACLNTITNKSLSEGLRGAFVYLYKSLYIQKEIINFELADVKTDILVDRRDERYDFLKINAQKIYDVKQAVFKNSDINLVNVIFKNFDIKNKEFTRSLIDLSLFAISYSMFDKTEFRQLEKELKELLLEHGPSENDSRLYRKFSIKGSIKSLQELEEKDAEEEEKLIKVSKLQNVDWMSGAVQILLKCLEFNYSERFDKFARIDAVKLEVDGEGLRKKYTSGDVATITDEKLQEDRIRVKNFMDMQTTENEPYPKIMLELINPKYPELSECVLEYLDTIIVRDELTLENFAKRFSLSKTVGPKVKEDFDFIMEICFKSRISLDVLELSIDQKEVSKCKEQFFVFKKTIRELVSNIYRVIETEDQMKKHEVTYDMLINNDIFFEDFEVSKYDNVLASETTFFFNILNDFLGKSTNYKNRKEIILDLEILENCLRVFLKLFKFIEVFKIKFDDITGEYENQKRIIEGDIIIDKEAEFEFDKKYVEKNILGLKFSEIFLHYFLLGNFVFLRPSAYNRDFLKSISKDLIKVGKMILNPKNGFNDKMILIFLKFIASILKDNYSVLVSVEINLINFLIKRFSTYLNEENYTVAIGIFEVFEILVEFRGTGVIENVNMVYFRLMEIINARKSKLRDLVNTEFGEWLRNTPIRKNIKKIDMSMYNWKSFYSKNANNLGMTKEKPAVYDYAVIPQKITLVYKFFNILNIFLTSKNPEIQATLQSSYSLGFLINLIKDATGWYPLKKSLVEFIKTLYIKKDIVSGNLVALTTAFENELMEDFAKFDSNLKNSSPYDEMMIITNIDSIKFNYLEENVYKPYFGHICWNNSDAFKEYAVKGIGKLLYEYMKILEIPGKLKNLDVSILIKYKDLFYEYNYAKGRTGDLLKVEKPKFFEMKEKKYTKKDDFTTKFREEVEEEGENFDGVLDMIDNTKNEFIMYDNFFSTQIFSSKKKAYIGRVTRKSLETSLDVQELQTLKKELFKEEFVFSVNQEDYYQFMNTTLNILKTEPFKFDMFLKDVITLMENKGQSFKQIERKVNLLRRIIEKSENPRNTLITLSEFGLFEKLLDKYSENSHDENTCLMITSFLTTCLEVGRQPVQKEIIRVLQERPTNSFIVAVTDNLKQKFDKFVQRITLKNNFVGFALLSPEDQGDMMRPIKEAEDYYINTLEMLRWFCEGHFTPLQDFFRVQAHHGKNKPNQVNMVELMENHLKRFSKLLDTENYAIGRKILEFLVEIIQGPCVGNQEEVASCSIIELLEEISTTLINGFELMDEEVKSGLINQIVLVFLGVIENNKDPLANSKVALSTNSDAFWDRLIQIQAIFDQNQDFFDKKNPDKKLQDDIASRLAKIVDEDEKRKKRKKDTQKKRKKLEEEEKKKQEKEEEERKLNDRRGETDESLIHEVKINHRDGELPQKVVQEEDEEILTDEEEEEKPPSKREGEKNSKEEKHFTLSEGKETSRPKKDISGLKMYSEDLTNYSDICFEGINITILFMQLKNYKPEYNQAIENDFKVKRIGRYKELARKARKTFFSLVRTIEVSKEDRNLEKVYFAIPAITRFHSNDSKEHFNENVDRTTSSTKLTGLSEAIPSILFEMKHFTQLNKGGSNFKLTMITQLRKINFALALAINFMILVFTEINDESDKTGRFQAFDLGNLNTHEWILFGLCCAAGFMYLLTLIFWFILAFAIEKQRIRNSEKEELKQKLTQEQLDELKEDPYSELNKLLEISKTRLAFKILTSTYLPMILGLIILCALGMTFSKLFLAFLMVDIVTLNPLLNNVIHAFVMKRRALVVVFIFGTVQIFIFTSITYFSKLRQFLTFIDDDNLEMCYNYIHCFIMTMNFGMRSGGGIGEALLYPGYKDNKDIYLGRSVFDFLFFFAIIIIILEIVFGLIVDSFGELREQRDIKINDQNSKCFICDLKDGTFARQNLSFENHRDEKHNHWNYAYYVIGALLKDEDELNGMESYVLEKYENNELTWFPVGRALELNEDSIEKGIEEKIDNIGEKIEYCIEEVLRQNRVREDIANREETND